MLWETFQEGVGTTIASWGCLAPKVFKLLSEPLSLIKKFAGVTG